MIGGTPFEALFEKAWTIVPQGIQEAHPGDRLFRDLGVQGVAAFRTDSPSGEPLGLLLVLASGALEIEGDPLRLLQTLARRAGVELAAMASQRRLEATRGLLESVIRAVPDPVFVKDRQHR